MSFRLFIDNWKGSNPIFLKLQFTTMEMYYMLKEYKINGRIADFDEW